MHSCFKVLVLDAYCLLEISDALFIDFLSCSVLTDLLNKVVIHEVKLLELLVNLSLLLLSHTVFEILTLPVLRKRFNQISILTQCYHD